MVARLSVFAELNFVRGWQQGLRNIKLIENCNGTKQNRRQTAQQGACHK